MRLTITVNGRPAPQGSKHLGGAGQLIESSAYLPAWRTAVKVAVYRQYAAMGITKLPVWPAGTPLKIEQCMFFMAPEQGTVTGKPDVDKLLRAVLDALGGAGQKSARLFADDSQIVWIDGLRKASAPSAGLAGALIVITDEFRE